MRSARKRSCRAAKETFVATRRVGVGPGVKIEEKSSTRKFDMVSRGYCVPSGYLEPHSSSRAVAQWWIIVWKWSKVCWAL